MVVKSPKLRPLERQQQNQPQQHQQNQKKSSKPKKTNALGRLFHRNKNANVKKPKKIKAPLSNLLEQDSTSCMLNDHDDHEEGLLQSSKKDYSRKKKETSNNDKASPSHWMKRKDPSDLLYEDPTNDDEEYFHTVDDKGGFHEDEHYLQKVELNDSGEYGNDMGCTLQNAWNMLCQDGNQVSKNQVGATNLAQPFHVRVDVMQDLSPEELAGLGLQHDLDYTVGGSMHEPYNGQQQQQQQQQQRNENEVMMLTRSALSRPFGRTSLPAHLAKRWVVQVSFAGYDDKIGACLYNIIVQVEDPGSYTGTPIPSPIRAVLANDSSSGGNSSLVAASVDRSLNDFIWLEDALLQEYRGSLIFPMLSLAVTSWADLDVASSSSLTSKQLMDRKYFDKRVWDPVQVSMNLIDEAVDSKEPLDTKLLADWLNDVLNSVRGRGELILNHKMEDVIHSEAMETFLYKTSSPLPKPRRKLWNDRKDVKVSFLDFRNVLQLHDSQKDCVQSAFAGLFKANLKCLGIMDGCDLIRTQDEFYVDGSGELVLPRRNIQQGKYEYSTGNIKQPCQSESLCAQRFYIAIQKENTLRAMYCLRILLDKEILLSAAWKRLAISLSMLFAAEKDIEVCKVATTKTSSPVKSIKLDRETVDDNLRILARQKVDRSIPGLKVLSGMLNAYYADFSAVEPSLDEYATSIQKLISPDSNNGGWQSQLKAISPVKLLSMGSEGSNSISAEQQEMERQEIRQKLAANEEHMISSITQFCKATKIRTARMSWKYFKMELGQVSLLLSACEQTKTNLKRAIARNEIRVDVEKAHFDRELELVKLIMELGLKKKYKYNPIPKSSCGSSHTSSETSDVSDFDKSREGDSETMTTDEGGTIQSKVVENIISLSKEYAGRWNLDFTVKMLEASGIPNVSFDMEDTSKNIRTVLKLITTLRESVERCKKAVDMLKAFGVEVSCMPFQDKSHHLPMHVLRHNFTSELVRVFSCTCHPSKSMNMDASWERMLSSIGVDIHDSAGWLKREEVRGGGRCGTATVKYEAMRNHGAHDFISLLEERLKSYHVLMEEIENYIWMHRAGDYIEKYYSNVRAQALAAWEKKTDITTAITIATKKKLMLLVNELKEKLELIGDSVSYSSVKEAKERHLGSKALKSELESLACRRFQKLKETCTDHSLSIMSEWTLREESIAKVEAKYLNEIIREIESNVRRHENAIQADGGAHLFAVSLSRKPSSSTTRSSSHSSSQRIPDGMG